MRGGWFEVLEVARGLSKKEGFTAPELAQAAGLKDAADKSAAQIAAQWLYKFKLWGYVEVEGTRPSGGLKPFNVYRVTDKGRSCKPRAGRELQLKKLIEAVRALEKARRTSREESAYGNLIRVCDEVDG